MSRKKPKKKRTFAEQKKAAAVKKDEAFEALCLKCGMCCHIKIGLMDGTYVMHPTITCKYLTSDNQCSHYQDRSKDETVICINREEMVQKDYILPEGCPYTKLRPGYKPARVVTQDEFDEILKKELEAGNYNILLANRLY